MDSILNVPLLNEHLYFTAWVLLPVCTAVFQTIAGVLLKNVTFHMELCLIRKVKKMYNLSCIRSVGPKVLCHKIVVIWQKDKAGL